MCVVRLNAYPMAVESVRVEGTRITLGLCTVDEKDIQRALRPFPVHLVTERELLDAVLMHSACTDSMMGLYYLAKELFDGRSAEVHDLLNF